jgi:hypothetical protein
VEAYPEITLDDLKEIERRAEGPAVRVYRVKGNAEVDYWEEPVTLAKFGDHTGTLSNERY